MILKNLKNLSKESVSHHPEIFKQVFCKPGVIPNITQIASAEFLPGQKVSKHSHEKMQEVFYVVSGELEVVVNNKPVSLSAGSLLVVEAGEEHAMGNNGSELVQVFYFGVESKGG